MRLPRLARTRIGVRLARRELWRRPWRSVLVMLMVFVPAFVMTLTAIYLRTSEYTRAEHAAAQYGRADAYARPTTGPITPLSLRALRAGLPKGTPVVVERSLADRVREGDRRAYFSISDLPLDDPMADGRYGTVRGRLPRIAREAVVSDEVARDLHLEIGDAFTPERLGRELRVVGTVRVRLPGYVAGEGTVSNSDGQVLVRGPLSDAAFVTSIAWIDEPVAKRTGLAFNGDQLVSISPIDGWNTYPVNAFNETDQTSGVFWTYVGGAVGLIILATIITAAFAVGARRQLSTIGLLSSSGASPATIKWFLITQGFVLGVLGSAAGVLAGVVAVQLTPQRILDGFDLRPDGVVTRPLDLIPIVVLGAVVAALAAWLPARSAAKVPTLQALAGRRPLSRVPRRVPMLGAASIAVGCLLFGVSVATLTSGGASGLLLFPITGAVAILLGAVAIAPWVIERIEHGSARWPESWRLAGRSLGRSRVRSSAVVGAVCAVVMAVVAGTTLYASLGPDSGDCCRVELPQQRQNQVILEMFTPIQSVPVSKEIVDRVRAVVPDAEVVPLTELAVPGSERIEGLKSGSLFASYVSDQQRAESVDVRVAAATPQLLDVFQVPADFRDALDRGQAVSVVRPPFGSNEIKVVVGGASRTLPLGGSFDSAAASSALPGVLVSPATAESLGLASQASPWTLLELPRPLSEHQRRELDLLSNDIRWEQNTRSPLSPYFNISLPSDNFEVSPGYVKAGLLAISLLFVLGVVAVGLALAARDSEDERQVLSAVGAPPRTLRRVGALRGAFLALAAAMIAVPAGLLASVVIVSGWESFGEFRVDWWAVSFALVVVPVVVGAVTLGAARVRDAIRPPRPDVFAFTE